MFLVSEKMTDGSLSDRTRQRHQTFASSMARFGRRLLLSLVTYRENQSFLERTIVLPLAFSLGRPFGDALGS